MLVLLLYVVLGEDKYNNLYTVHDCFAVTAYNVESLITKGVYLKMYSDDVYMVNLHNFIKETINKTQGIDTFIMINILLLIKDFIF